jgi:hypothetical protein
LSWPAIATQPRCCKPRCRLLSLDAVFEGGDDAAPGIKHKPRVYCIHMYTAAASCPVLVSIQILHVHVLDFLLYKWILGMISGLKPRYSNILLTCAVTVSWPPSWIVQNDHG